MKRGPKGKQWITWNQPFQPSSTAGQAFVMLCKKGGIQFSAFKKFITARGASLTWVMYELRKCHRKGWVWEFDDSQGRIRITDVILQNKNWKKGDN